MLLLAVVVSTRVLDGTDNPKFWNTGKVLDPKEQAYFTSDEKAVASSGLATCAPSSEGKSAWCRQFVIEGEAFAYLVQERLRGKNTSTPALVFGDAVKYATDESRIFYRGDDGQKHERVNRKLFVRAKVGRPREMEIVSKVRLPPQRSVQP